MNTNPTWRTSSHSDGMQCVAVADLGDGLIGIKSSKDRDHYTRGEFAAFVKGVKDGEFDDLSA